MNYGTVSQRSSIASLYYTPEELGIKIGQAHEETPLDTQNLIRRRQTINSIVNCKVFFLFLIFVLGLSIGLYLLIVEYHVRGANFRYSLVELSTWYGEDASNALFADETRMQLPVTNIFVSHTRGDHCYSFKECSTIISGMIRDDPSDIPYNFLISGAGDCYEVRGWNYESYLPAVYNKNESIVVGFIGDFTTNVLTEQQFAELNAFINGAIRRRQLNKNYILYGIQSDLKMHDTLDDMQQWNGIL